MKNESTLTTNLSKSRIASSSSINDSASIPTSIKSSVQSEMNKIVIIDDEDDDRKPAAKTTCEDSIGKKRKRNNLNPIDLTQTLEDEQQIEKRNVTHCETSIIDLSESQDDVIEIIQTRQNSLKSRKESGGDSVNLTIESLEPAIVQTYPVVDSNDNNNISNVYIYIDNRERNRNCTPRYLRTQLNLIVSEGSIGQLWPYDLPKAIVEEKKIPSGDFEVYVSKENSQDEQERIPVWIERKRISDLVQRSFHKDHWMQMHRSRDEASSHSTGMNDGGICILLLEGDIRNASLFTPYGAQKESDTRNEHSHTIDNEDCVYYYMARSILSSPSIRFYQAKDEQAALRGVGALAIMSILSQQIVKNTNHANKACSGNLKRLLPQKQIRQQLQERLIRAGVPYPLATRVSEEIGSEMQLDTLYGMADVDCRDCLLVPIINDVVSQIKEEYQGTALSWSTGIHRSYYSVLNDPDVGRTSFDEAKEFVEDHGNLLAKIHLGQDVSSAVLAVFAEPILENSASIRTLHIHGPLDMESIFHIEKDHDIKSSFYRLHTYVPEELSIRIPVFMMQTKCSRYQSNYFYILLMDGTEFLDRVCHISSKEIAFNKNTFAASRSIAQKIHDDCYSAANALRPIDTTQDAVVLLIRGLNIVLDRYKKSNSYQEHILSLTELVLADCMLHHGLTVIQAVHLVNDRENILKQCALACYQCQLLTKISTTGLY